MAGSVRSLLVLPISPSEPGNGLAHRCRVWVEALHQLGPSSTVVVPIAGPGRDGDRVVRLETIDLSMSALPAGAQRAPEALGRRWALDPGGGNAEAVDLVVAVGADLGPFALGLASATPAAVVIDVNDDDAALHRSLGNSELAARYERLIPDLVRRADLVTSVSGFGGTTPVPNAIADLVAALREVVVREPSEVVAWAGYLSVTTADDGVAVMDDASMTAHHLNPSAAAVFLLAGDEGASPAAIAEAVGETLELDPRASRALVDAALPDLLRAGLLVAHRGRQRQ